MHEEPMNHRDPQDLKGEASGATARLDEGLRRALEPHPAVVARVVRGALEGSDPAPRRRWLLAAAGAFLLLLASAIPRIPNEPPPVENSPLIAQQRLRISNEGGVVKVTTPAGSALVILPGDLR